MGLSPDALYNAVFDDVSEYIPFGPVALGNIPPDASYKQFACSHLISSVVKKFTPDSSRDADAVAKEKFFASNKKCEDWKLPQLMESDRILLGEFRRELDDFLHPGGLPLFSSFYELIENARTGPGSSIGSKGFSLYAKLFSSQLTTTSLMLDNLFRDYFAWFPTFDEAIANGRRVLGEPRIVYSSRCSFAPKTRDCSRMICVEPSLNMFFQLGLGTLISNRLREQFSVDLSTQPDINRRLAQEGSKYGRFCTIDLSSASDSISLKLCEEFLPKWFFDTLLELRSPSTLVDSVPVKLNMISTMGNGFTFPLETLIFSCLIRAAYRVSDFPIFDESHGWSSNWACFGDDLICDSKCFRNVKRLLDLLGFETNGSKTFSEGPFKESCGSDWFFGQPVRPVFIKKLDSLQDILVAVNLLNNWTAYTGVPLRGTIKFLLSSIRRDLSSLFVPYSENLNAGVRVPLSLLPRKSMVWDSNQSLLYRPFRPIPKTIKVEDGTLKVPKGFKELIWNPQGLHISFLYGELCDYAIPVRHDRVRYSQKLQCTPFWDFAQGPISGHGTELVWQQWETAVSINLDNPHESE